MDLSLARLMEVKVSSVSKKQENLDNAPGVVTVISAQQIKALAAKNLTDVLKTVPGVFAFDNYFSLTDQFSIRGNLSEDYNTKILFLINGHPSYHTLNTTFFSDMVPIEAVERVEVVRGPVSVLYGTNALTGVINVITKKTWRDSDAQASVDLASHNTRIARMNYRSTWDEGQWVVFSQIKRTDGFDQFFSAAQDDPVFSFKQNIEVYAGEGGNIQLGEEHNAIFSQLIQGNLEVDISYFDQKRSQKQGISPSLYFHGDPFNIDLLALDSRYQLTLSENTRLRFIGRFDDYQYKYTVGNYQELDVGLPDTYREAFGKWHGKKYGVEVIADIDFQPWEFIFGLMYDNYRGDKVSFETGETSAYWFAPQITGINANFELIPTNTQNDDQALYTNNRFHLSQSTDLVFGARFTENGESGNHTDYRIGSIHNVDNQTFKILWGTAYRSANLNEYNVSATPVILGNSELNFETLKGLDITYFYKGDSYSFGFNYFWNETDDEITTRSQLDPNVGLLVPTYTNVAGKESDGVEYEFNYYFSENSSIYFRGSHLFTVKESDSESNIKYGTIRTIKAAGLSTQLSDAWNVNINGIYNGDWQGEGSYYLWNLSSHYQYNKNLQFHFDVQNITDKNYDYAIWQGNWISQRLPAADPRTITLGFQYHW